MIHIYIFMRKIFHCFYYMKDAVKKYDFSSINSSTLTFKTKLKSAIHVYYIVCSMFNVQWIQNNPCNCHKDGNIKMDKHIHTNYVFNLHTCTMYTWIPESSKIINNFLFLFFFHITPSESILAKKKRTLRSKMNINKIESESNLHFYLMVSHHLRIYMLIRFFSLSFFC